MRIIKDLNSTFLLLLLLFVIVSALVFAADDSTRELYQQAEQRYSRGDYMGALLLFDRVISQDSLGTLGADARFKKAMCLLQLERYDASLDIFHALEDRYTWSRYEEYVPFWVGYIHNKRENYEASVKPLYRYLSREEGTYSTQARLLLAQALLTLGKPDEAEKVLEKYIQEADEDLEPRAFLLYLSLLLQSEEYSRVLEEIDSRESLLSGLSQAEAGPYVTLYRGEALWGLSRKEEASKLYMKLLSRGDKISSVSHKRLFSFYREKGNQEKMTEIIGSAETLLANQEGLLEDFWLRIGVSFSEKGNYQRGKEYLLRVWRLSENDAKRGTAALHLAEVYILEGDQDRAAEIMNKALELEWKEKADLLWRRARLALSRHRWEEAEAYFSQFISTFPENQLLGKAKYYRAFALYKMQSYTSAYDLLSKVPKEIREADYLGPLLRLRSKLAERMGKEEVALEGTREYLDHNPKDIAARADLVRLYYKKSDYQRVIEAEEKLRKEVPGYWEEDPLEGTIISYITGLAMISERHYQKAEHYLTRALEQKEAIEEFEGLLPYITFYLGWTRYSSSSYQEAYDELSRFVKNYPNHSLSGEATYVAGWCAYALGNYEEAVDQFGLFTADKYGGEKKIHGIFMHAKALVQLDKREKAILLFERISRDYPDSPYGDDALYEYANTLIDLGKEELAIEAYSSFPFLYPEASLTEQALYRKAEVLMNIEQYEEASEAFYEYRSAYPDGALYDAALYWGGMASKKAGKSQAALLLWDILIKQEQESPFLGEALKESAELYEDQGNYSKALSYYQKLSARFPELGKRFSAGEKASKIEYLLLGKTDREAELSVIIGKEGGVSTRKGREAMLELSRVYMYKTGNRQDLALPLLKKVVEAEDIDAETAARGKYLQGEYYYRKGKLREAGSRFLQAAISYPRDRDFMASSLYRAAEMALLAGYQQDAEEIVERITKNFPDSQWSEAATDLLKEGGSR